MMRDKIGRLLPSLLGATIPDISHGGTDVLPLIDTSLTETSVLNPSTGEADRLRHPTRWDLRYRILVIKAPPMLISDEQIGMSAIAHVIAGTLLPVLKLEVDRCPSYSMEPDRPHSGMAHPAAALVRGCQLGRRNGCLDATPNAAA